MRAVSEKYRYAENLCRDFEGQWEPWHDCIAFSQTIHEVTGILKIVGSVLFGVFLIVYMVYRYRNKIEPRMEVADQTDASANY
jgi:hypothetical protein